MCTHLYKQYVYTYSNTFTLCIFTYKHHTLLYTLIYTVTIWLSVSLYLSAFFIEVKIHIIFFTLTHDKITSNQIETMYQTFRKQQNHQTKLKLCSKHSESNKISNKNQIQKSFSITYQNNVRSFPYFQFMHRNKGRICFLYNSMSTQYS